MCRLGTIKKCKMYAGEGYLLDTSVPLLHPCQEPYPYKFAIYLFQIYQIILIGVFEANYGVK